MEDTKPQETITTLSIDEEALARSVGIQDYEGFKQAYDSLQPHVENTVASFEDVVTVPVDALKGTVIGTLKGANNLVELAYDFWRYQPGNYVLFNKASELGLGTLPDDIELMKFNEASSTTEKAFSAISEFMFSFYTASKPAATVAKAFKLGSASIPYIQGAIATNIAMGPKDYYSPDVIIQAVRNIQSPQLTALVEEALGDDPKDLEWYQNINRRILGTAEGVFFDKLGNTIIDFAKPYVKTALNKQASAFSRTLVTLIDMSNAAKRNPALASSAEAIIESYGKEVAEKAAAAEEKAILKEKVTKEALKKGQDVTTIPKDDLQIFKEAQAEVGLDKEVISEEVTLVTRDKTLGEKVAADVREGVENVNLTQGEVPDRVASQMYPETSKYAGVKEDVRKNIKERVKAQPLISSIMDTLKNHSTKTTDEILDVIHEGIAKGVDAQQASRFGLTMQHIANSKVIAAIKASDSMTDEVLEELLNYNKIVTANEGLGSVGGGLLGDRSGMKKLVHLNEEAFKATADDLVAKARIAESKATIKNTRLTENFSEAMKDPEYYKKIKSYINKENPTLDEIMEIVTHDLEFEKGIRKNPILEHVKGAGAWMYANMISGPITMIKNGLSPRVFVETERIIAKTDAMIAKIGGSETYELKKEISLAMDSALKESLDKSGELYRNVFKLLKEGASEKDIMNTILEVEPLAGSRIPNIVSKNYGRNSQTARLAEHWADTSVTVSNFLKLMDASSSLVFGSANLIDLVQSAITTNALRKRELIKRAGELAKVHDIPLKEAINMVDSKEIMKDFNKILSEGGAGLVDAIESSPVYKAVAAAEVDTAVISGYSVNLVKSDREAGKLIVPFLKAAEALQGLKITAPLAPFVKEQANATVVMAKQLGVTRQIIDSKLALNPALNYSDRASRVAVGMGAIALGTAAGYSGIMGSLGHYYTNLGESQDIGKIAESIPFANIGPIPTIVGASASLGAGVELARRHLSKEEAIKFEAEANKILTGITADILQNTDFTESITKGLSDLLKGGPVKIAEFLPTLFPLSGANRQINKFISGNNRRYYIDYLDRLRDAIATSFPGGTEFLQRGGVEERNHFGTIRGQEKTSREIKFNKLISDVYRIKPNNRTITKVDGRFKLTRDEQEQFMNIKAEVHENSLDFLEEIIGLNVPQNYKDQIYNKADIQKELSRLNRKTWDIFLERNKKAKKRYMDIKEKFGK